MRAVVIGLIQVVLAVLVAGLAMPVLLVTVPGMREGGPLVLVFAVVILFVLLRLAWSAVSGGTPREGGSRRDEPPR